MLKNKKKNTFFIALIIGWFVAISIPLTFMMGSHTLAVHPSKSDSLRSIASFSEVKKLNLIHFLSTDCKCSQEVYEYLVINVDSIQKESTNNKIIIVGDNHEWIKNLKDIGYDVDSYSHDEFSQKADLNAFPQLSVYSKADTLLYSGGYKSGRGPSSAVELQDIVSYLEKNTETNKRPIFGCISNKSKHNTKNPFFRFYMNLIGK